MWFIKFIETVKNSQENNFDMNVSKKIPLLEEVLETFPTMAINLDFKIDNDELIDKVSFNRVYSFNFCLILKVFKFRLTHFLKNMTVSILPYGAHLKKTLQKNVIN